MGGAAEFVSLDFGSGGSPELHCRARTVHPCLARLAELHCCCGLQHGRWRSALVSVTAGPGAGSLLLRCTLAGDASSLALPLLDLRGLRRLPSPRGGPPGLELRFAGRRPRLQLRALAPGGPESLPGPRLQLLHAFLAALAEERQSHRRPRAVVPLQWPLEEGRKASLEHLAAVLRGVTLASAADVGQRAPFAGAGCAVCLQRWQDAEPAASVAVLRCGHAFCEDCLFSSAVQLRASCPTCRADFGPPGQRSAP
ncbi:unnamed protein product [Prorocentrum cordatum]|uniref:RING-type domain-containing protein n=1 Tax=Prorocentrum cordatum TaxID=2364126 RepID=A0ABN9UW48_9DINO|nr:unnamed protein product [Polarella glacialis]